MASRSGGVGKSIVLLVLIIILTLLGLLWFDFLGVIHAKKYFSPLYKLMGLSPQTSVSGTAEFPIVADLDEDRLAVRLEALDARTEELNQREAEVKRLESENQQIAQELEDRRISQDEREKTFNNTLKQHDDRDKNIAQISANLNGMNPEAAVNILLAMDDQDVIDVLRKTEDDAQASGKSSMVAYWLSLMPSERAAKISEKSANKPISLD